MGAREIEQRLNRKSTEWFVDCDPTTLVLIPRVKQNRPGGSHRFVDGTPREPQDFKFIYPGGDGIVVTADGETRRFDFILVGSHDGRMDIGDHWTETDANGVVQNYVIEYLYAPNGYEIKGGGVTHGEYPEHG